MALGRLRDSAGASAEAVSFAACELAARLDARAIIAPVHDAAAVLAIARLRPRAPVLALTRSEALWRRLAMVRGVAPLLQTGGDERADLALAREWLSGRGLAQAGDPAVLVFVSEPGRAVADSLRTMSLG
jgi:pyruvate kinase